MNESPTAVPFALLAAVSVAAWVAFATVFRVFWSGGVEPGDPLGVFWVWFAIGVPAFVVVGLWLLRALRLPPSTWGTAALAMTAPALCCDVLTISFFEAWFPDGGAADDRRYAAFIVGGVGTFQLAFLALARLPAFAPRTPAHG